MGLFLVYVNHLTGEIDKFSPELVQFKQGRLSRRPFFYLVIYVILVLTNLESLLSTTPTLQIF